VICFCSNLILFECEFVAGIFFKNPDLSFITVYQVPNKQGWWQHGIPRGGKSI
jgi:hypothetical protein